LISKRTLQATGLFSTLCILALLLSSCSPPQRSGKTVIPTKFSTPILLLPSQTFTPTSNLTATQDWEQLQVTLDELKTEIASLPTRTPTQMKTPRPTSSPEPSLPPTELSPTPVPGISTVISDCRRSVNGMRVITKCFTGRYHNVNGYFTVLNHLAIMPGYTLDVVVAEYGWGAIPYVYARPLKQRPYTSYDEFSTEVGRPPLRDRISNAYLLDTHYLELANYYLDYIKADNTAEGFFQFIVLGILGEQFFSAMNGDYNDTIILCDQYDVVLAASDTKKIFGDALVLPNEVLQDAKELPLAPVVELGKDTATVRVVTFTKWGGFVETKYELTRTIPLRVVGIWQKILVPYDCGCTIN
jgi:hypothetical protein